MHPAFTRRALLVLLLVMLVTPAWAQSPLGQWRTIDDETSEPKSIVEVYEQEGALYGRVLQIINASAEAQTNDRGEVICSACEGDREGEPIEGMVIMEGLEKDGDEWSGGRILDPAKGKTYKVKLWLEDENTLKVRGFIGFSLIGRTQTWERV